MFPIQSSILALTHKLVVTALRAFCAETRWVIEIAKLVCKFLAVTKIDWKISDLTEMSSQLKSKLDYNFQTKMEIKNLINLLRSKKNWKKKKKYIKFHRKWKREKKMLFLNYFKGLQTIMTFNVSCQFSYVFFSPLQTNSIHLARYSYNYEVSQFKDKWQAINDAFIFILNNFKMYICIQCRCTLYTNTIESNVDGTCKTHDKN